MLTTKRVITDDDRQGGYTTTVNRAAPVFNFNSRAPRADVSEYSEYETDRLEAMRRAAPAASRTEAPYIERPARRYPEPRRVYSEEDLMPSIQTMQTVRTARQGRPSAAKRTEHTSPEGRAEKKALSQNAKLLIAVYAIIVFIALVLIIASAVAANNAADNLTELESNRSSLLTQVGALNEDKLYYTPKPASDEYVTVDDAEVQTFPVKDLGEKTEYKKQSNLFDKICDFFSKLAGGG